MREVLVAPSDFARLVERCNWLSPNEQFIALAALAFMDQNEISVYRESLIREGKLRGVYLQLSDET